MYTEVNTNQKRLLQFMSAHPHDPTYNITKLFEIEGAFNVAEVKKAMDCAARGISALKTNFINCGEYYLQQYEEERKPELLVEDKLDAFEVIKYCEERAKTPFNIEEWPLMECKVFLCQCGKKYLLFSISHLIADAYSAYMFFKRFARVYKQEGVQLEDIELISEPELSDKTISAAKKYYEKELEGVTEPELTKIRQRRTDEGLLLGDNTCFCIDDELSKKIRTFCAHNGITPFAFFATVYAIVIQKTTEENKIVIGVPFSGRINKKQRELFGYMVNTLPMCVDINEKESVSVLSKKISEKIYKMMRFQNVDFQIINEKMTGMPNNIITYHKKELVPAFEGCKTKEVHLSINQIMNELQVDEAEEENRFRIDVRYGKYYKDFSFEEAYKCVIEESVLNKNIEDIKLLSEDNQNKTYNALNQYKKYCGKNNVADVFKEIARKNANRIAVSCDRKTYTYEELDFISDKIACYLHSKYSEQTHIAYSVYKDIDLICIILGIVKSGKVCVPIDLYNPVERKKYILDDLENVLFIHEKDIEIETSQTTMLKEDLFGNIAQFTDADMNEIRSGIKIDNSNGLYMIYTSGTTGKPKGVEITHRNLLSLIESTKDKFTFTSNDVWTMFHSYGFDFSVWEMYGCLLSGGRLVLVQSQVCKSAEDFYKLVVDEKITVLNQTPTAFNDFINKDIKNKKELHLRYVIFGGEKLNSFMLKKWIVRHSTKDVSLVNMYGITETTIHVTYHELSEDEIKESAESNIGRPLSNLGVYILDKNRNLLPKGVMGEIAVYGDGVSNGYYRKSEMTKCKFTNIRDINDKIYLSGDVGYIDKNGDIIYANRKDKQIQLRGYRIEKEEIEKVICNQPYVQQSVVIVDKGRMKEDILVAFYVASQAYGENQMKKMLSEYLPAYMIPARIICVDKIEMNNNGKVDVCGLKKKMVDEVQMLFEDEISNRVYSVIKDVTGITEIGEDENLFDIGVNSVHLPEIVNRLQNEFLITLEIVSLFKYTTISKIAKYVKGEI